MKQLMYGVVVALIGVVAWQVTQADDGSESQQGSNESIVPPKAQLTVESSFSGDYFDGLNSRYMLSSNISWRRTVEIVGEHLEKELEKELALRKASQETDPRKEINQNLRKILDAQFELRQRAAAKEVDELETLIQRRRQFLDERRNEKERILDEHLKDVVRESTGRGWDIPAFAP